MRYNRNLLGKVFADAGFTRGAEIGVRKGHYSKVLMDANPDLHMLLVDPWAPYHVHYPAARQEQIYEYCMKYLKGYNFTVIRKASMEAVKEVPVVSLDFVYIDADHLFDFVMEDIIHWSRRVRSGGVVACHDFHYGSNVEVVEAVQAYTRAHHIDPWYVTKESQPTAYWVKP
jgi:hypothetical protein